LLKGVVVLFLAQGGLTSAIFDETFGVLLYAAGRYNHLELEHGVFTARLEVDYKKVGLTNSSSRSRSKYPLGLPRSSWQQQVQEFQVCFGKHLAGCSSSLRELPGLSQPAGLRKQPWAVRS
jgi:hypothetical protein